MPSLATARAPLVDLARLEHDNPLGRFSYAEWRPAHLSSSMSILEARRA